MRGLGEDLGAPNPASRIAPKVLLPGKGLRRMKRIRCARSEGYRGEMDKTMSQPIQREVLEKLRRRYAGAGLEHKVKLLDLAVVS